MSSFVLSNGSALRCSWLWLHYSTSCPVSLSLIHHVLRPRIHSPLAKYFRWVFYISSAFVLLDFVLNIIWLPIAAHNTWGFRTAHEAFMETYNGTGAPAGWNWCLSYLATAGILIGFDASGHVAEETKNASYSAARGIFWSTVVSGFGGLATIILFLFCAVRIPYNTRTIGYTDAD